MLNYDNKSNGINNQDVKKVHEFGLIPQIVQDLLSISESKTPNIEYQIEVSFVEIYAEKIFDLLSDSHNHESGLRLHINPKIGTYIEGLTSLPVSSIDQVMKLIEKGFKHRSTSSTAMNEQSSRSHAIFNITFKTIKKSVIEQKIISEKISKIKLVDLAGSERVKTSKVTGSNYQEAIAINKSLSMLSMVFNELVENGTTTKCRNSILTSLLADSITGNSKTIIIANVSPASTQYEISLQSLLYVHRTKKIVVHAQINEITSEESKKLIETLKAEIESLKAQLTKTTDDEEIKRLKEELAEYENIYKDSSQSWSDKLKASHESIANLEVELVRRNSIISEIKEKSEYDIKKLTQERDNLEKDKNKIIQEIKNKHEALEELSNDIIKIQLEKTILMNDKIAISNEKVQLMNNIHDLILEKDKLTALIHEMHHNIEILRHENNELIKTNSELNNSIKKIQLSHNADKSKFVNQLNQLNNLFKPL